MAISRASFEDIPIHLVSSIPSLETYNHIKNKKYSYTKIKKRFSEFPLPDAKVINLNLLLYCRLCFENKTAIPSI